jgi:hypothetical protein
MSLFPKRQIESDPLRNEAQLNCVSLRSQLDHEVAGSAVKGHDERSLRNALDSAPCHTRPSAFRKRSKEGRHVGLDFYDLLIEAGFTCKWTGFANAGRPGGTDRLSMSCICDLATKEIVGERLLGSSRVCVCFNVNLDIDIGCR